MPDFIKAISTLQQHMTTELSRSDVLRALIWPFAALLFATVSASAAKSATWLLVVLVILLVLNALLYGVAYGYCLMKDRDALRSEKYSLNKIAIEHGLLGDSLRGMIDQIPPGEMKTITANPQAADKEI